MALVQKTIKSSGGDYVSLKTLADADVDLVSAGDSWQVTCDNIANTDQAVFNGWATGPSNYLHVIAADAHASGGAVTTNGYRLTYSGSNAPVLFNGTGVGAGGLIIFEGLQFAQALTGPTNYVVNTSSLTAANTIRFINCILTGGTYALYANSVNATCEFINCIVLSASRAIYVPVACTNKIYHCTVYGTTYGLADNHASAVHTVKNSYIGGGTSSFHSFKSNTMAQTNVATSDADSDTVALRNIAYDANNFVSVTGGSENLHLPVGSALLQVGASLSGESEPFNVPTDIDGEGRNLATPDIGADEKDAVAAASASKPLFVLGF